METRKQTFWGWVSDNPVTVVVLFLVLLGGFALELELAFISAFQVVAVAIIGYFSKREAVKHKRNTESLNERAARRAAESLLAMRLMNACVELGIATAVAIHEGKSNGTMTGALQNAQNAKAAYQDFISEVAQRNINVGDL